MNDANVWLATPGSDVCICGVGARTPLGLNALATAAAVRAGISALAAHPTFVDQESEPIKLACDAQLPIDMPVAERVNTLLLSAIADSLEQCSSIVGVARLGAVIGLPPARPGLPMEMGPAICKSVSAALRISPAGVDMIEQGHAAGLMAMQLAATRIATGQVDFCVVAGVDSYCDGSTLAWLDDSETLMSGVNRNGFPPGEAGGACVVASSAAAKKLGLPVLGHMAAACTAFEKHSIRTEEVCVGEGLSAAIDGVSAQLHLPQEAIGTTYCDINGERYRSEELTYTMLRTGESFVDPHDIHYPAGCFGDIGAASGPLYCCLAVVAAQRGYATTSNPLLWASSEAGHRSAVLLALTVN